MGKIPYRRAIKFYWDAQTIYSAHSPFIYQFIRKVMNNMYTNTDLEKIESKRKSLHLSTFKMPFIEYGAGSSMGTNSIERKVSDVAKNSLSGPWQCRILYNLIKKYGSRDILEIGTSLGISTAYLGSANREANIISLEGNPSSAAIATDVWRDLDINCIEVRVGEFDSTLNKAAQDLGNIDMAFIDGNHRKEATVKYFNILKTHAHLSSIYVIDDIYWSEGMNEAWNEIIKDDSVAFSIDLFRMGIVFFDHTIMKKQHFKLIPFRMKPWSIGVFG